MGPSFCTPSCRRCDISSRVAISPTASGTQYAFITFIAQPITDVPPVLVGTFAPDSTDPNSQENRKRRQRLFGIGSPISLLPEVEVREENFPLAAPLCVAEGSAP